MGCDIHCFPEYREPYRGPGHSYDPHLPPKWTSFGGDINPGRSYDLFAHMAGVRNTIGVEPIAAPRGWPDDTGYAAADARWLYVSPGSDFEKLAWRWIDAGQSIWLDADEREYVSNPDLHSLSWLTPDEFATVIAEGAGPEYHAILAALRSFESRGYDARLLIAFDS